MTDDDGVADLNRLAVDRAAALTLYARQWLDAADAEDAVQDALTALVSQSRRPDDPVAWMYRAVRNAAIDAARSETRRARRERTVAESRREWFAEHPDAALDARTAEQALRTLPADVREVVVLRIWADLGFAQIAQVTGTSVSAAHKRYTAALDQIRTVLETPSCKTNRTT